MKYIESTRSDYRFNYFLSTPFDDLNSLYNDLIPTALLLNISFGDKNKNYDNTVIIKQNQYIMKGLKSFISICVQCLGNMHCIKLFKNRISIITKSKSFANKIDNVVNDICETLNLQLKNDIKILNKTSLIFIFGKFTHQISFCEKKKLEENNFNKMDFCKYESNNKTYTIFRNYFTVTYSLTSENLQSKFKSELLKDFDDILNKIFECKNDCPKCKIIFDKQNILKVTNILPDINESICIDI